MRKLAFIALMALSCYPQDVDPMKVQPKQLPYSENLLFDDHRAMRTPEVGTIAREQRLGDAALTEGLAPNGDFVEQIPIPLTRDGLEKGRRQFDIYCAACHGLLGDGNSVVAHKMSLRAPPSLYEYKDKPAGFIYRPIARGYGFMPQYADILGIEDRWHVVGYVRALQLSQAQPVQSLPPEQQRKLQEERQ